MTSSESRVEDIVEGHRATVPVTGPIILVVDDDVIPRAAVAKELRERGYLVVEAADADDALAILRSNVAVDLVLTDIDLPGALNDSRLATFVRHRYPLMKLVIASAVLGRRGANVSADAYFSKPYDPHALVERIHSLLTRKGECGSSEARS